MENQNKFYGGLLEFAVEPSNNPDSSASLESHGNYGIALIEYDYPGKTPAMWNAAYEYFGIDSAVAMMVGDPSKTADILLEFKKDRKYIGGGCGVGFKDVAINHVDILDPLAEAVGAINLIEKLPSGELKGWNTDGIGYAQSLEEELKHEGKTLNNAKVVMIGAGGTGNAIAFALAERGAEIVIINRTFQKAEDLAGRINEKHGREVATAFGEDAITKLVSDADVVINVSTKGATGDFAEYSALAPATLPATHENVSVNNNQATEVMRGINHSAILSDVVLRGEPTPFLKKAKEMGFATLDGVPMVINQGVEAFLILHGDQIGRSEEVRSKLRDIMKKAANL